MMRQLRTAAVLLALSLLASVATAGAECTWVLWWETNSPSDWPIVGAWPSVDACEKQRPAPGWRTSSPAMTLCCPCACLQKTAFEAWAEVIAHDYEGLVAEEEASLYEAVPTADG